MKKILTIIVALFTFVAVANAQPRALGVRAGYGGEVSYQHLLGAASFAELDLGIYAGGLNLAGAYDFLLLDKSGLGIYAGPAADLLLYSSGGSSTLHGGLGGQVGFEYKFTELPIQISVDWRPIYFFGGGFDARGAALGVRYLF